MSHLTKLLVADDSPADRFFFARALRRTGLPAAIFEVEDGAETIDFLSNQGHFADPLKYPN